jgi:CubicO group peptidase (beta-lactamase class C family)
MLLVASLCLAPTPSLGSGGDPCAAPAADHDWPVSTPAAADFDATALCSVLEEAAASDANLHAVLVERRGRLVGELYRSGPDKPIDANYGLGRFFAEDVRFDANTLHDVRSISKSVVGLLVGNAVRDGKLQIASPALGAYPALADLRSEGREAITIEHLLTMSSGLRWDEWIASPLASDELPLLWKADQVRFLFDRPLVHEPGTLFTYNGGGVATLADLLTRATGRPLVELAREQLFEPLGITRWQWATDLRDRPLAYAGLRLRPRDMAKLGRLVLGRGRWRGQQLVPEAWIAESLRPHVSTGSVRISDFPQELGYGYLWWTGRIAWKGRELAWSAAVGNGGQRIYVVPGLDLTVVTTAGEYGSPKIGAAVGHIFAGIVAAATN